MGPPRNTKPRTRSRTVSEVRVAPLWRGDSPSSILDACAGVRRIPKNHLYYNNKQVSARTKRSTHVVPCSLRDTRGECSMNVCLIKHIHSPSANRQQDPLEFGPTIMNKITIRYPRRNLSLTVPRLSTKRTPVFESILPMSRHMQ